MNTPSHGTLEQTQTLLELTKALIFYFFPLFLFYSIFFEQILGLNNAGGLALYTAMCFNEVCFWITLLVAF